MLPAATYAASIADTDVEGVLVDRVYLSAEESAKLKPPEPGLLDAELHGKANAAWKSGAVTAAKTGLANSIVVKLKDDAVVMRGLVSQAGELAANANRYEFERAFVLATDRAARKPQSRSDALMATLGRPNAARLLISESRLADAGRKTAAEARSRRGDVAEDPLEALHRFVVLQYPSVASASAALKQIERDSNSTFESAYQDFAMGYSANATDTYFPAPTGGLQKQSNYQWGLHAMNFPAAWDRTRGGGYFGLADSPLWPATAGTNRTAFSPQNADLAANFRMQYAFLVDYPGGVNNFHGQHVGGIVAARSSLSDLAPNPTGTAGACPNCSIMNASGSDVLTLLATHAQTITQLVNIGAQVINLSSNASAQQPPTNCQNGPGNHAICAAIAFAKQRDVVVVISSGNQGSIEPRFPANTVGILPVGGVQLINDSGAVGASSNWQTMTGPGIVSNYASTAGISAPAKHILSTYAAGTAHISGNCGDASGFDQSSAPRQNFNDGVGTCTGTSMAAPHVSALAMMMRSMKPSVDYVTVMNRIRNAGHLAVANSEMGRGVPNALAALNAMTTAGANASAGSTRLIPLFSAFSANRHDYFYSAVPQQLTAAYMGTLQPIGSSPTNTGGTAVAADYYDPIGVTIAGYDRYPNLQPWDIAPTAEVWLFGSPENPKSAIDALVPVYRMSFACNHQLYVATQPAKCASNPKHIDTVLVEASNSLVTSFQNVGYRLDGLEGYVYSKLKAQPPGTVRLLRRYNPTQDDHAIYPETKDFIYQGQGYTSGTGWLGYVYENTGDVPTIQ
jgi:serine protease